MKPLLKLTGIAFLIIILFSNCKDESPVICDPTPQFDIDEFITRIELSLMAQPLIGYQLVVNKNGNFYAERNMGLARHDVDPNGPIDIVTSTRFNTASIAKFVGAIALLIAMEEKGISLETNFREHLPPSWQDTTHVSHQYTIRELLTHQTEIDFLFPRTQTEVEMLNALIAPPDPENKVYQNGNFTLIRVLIGEIVYDLDELSSTYSIDCTDRYFQYLDEKIFTPLNLSCPKSAADVINYYNTSTYPWAYQFPLDTTFSDASGFLGWPHSHNVYRTGGSAGLIFSALEIAEIMAYFRHDDSELLLSTLDRDQVLEFELGLNNTIMGDRGRYQCKQGRRGPDTNINNRAIQSTMMFFPNGVEVVLISNSAMNNQATILRDVFDASWINPC